MGVVVVVVAICTDDWLLALVCNTNYSSLKLVYSLYLKCLSTNIMPSVL